MSSTHRRIAPALLALALAAALPVAAQQPAPAPAAAAATEKEAEVAPEAVVPLDEIRRFVAVFNTVRGAYVEPIDDKRLMQAAIRGLLLDLDPHSAYLVREQAAAFLEDPDGAYDGIGVEVQPQPDGTILIIAPIDDTPAARAGVKAGDLIIAIDGKTLAPGVEEQNPLRGKPGSSTRLTIVRKGEKAPLELVVKRDTIRVGSVRNRMLEPGYGYIRIAAFQVDTAQEFRRQLAKLQGEASGAFFERMYGNQPDLWHDDLEGIDRLRFTVNALTRLRACDASGRMLLKLKGPVDRLPPGAMPWFRVPGRRTASARVVCGHWSALGYHDADGVLALDTGCVWGGTLTAQRLDAGGGPVSVSSEQPVVDFGDG